MILLQFFVIFVLYKNAQCQEKTYLVTAPRIWRVGASETVVVQAFGLTEKLNIRISLVSYPDKKTKYASQHLLLTPGGHSQGLINLMIQPKDLPRKAGTMQFVYLEALSDIFTKEEKVPITYDNGFLFIQTDKPIYTPDQSVKVRVYSMDEELKPARRSVTLTFQDPEGVKVDIMGEKDLTGIISVPDFKIPANPKYGVWTIQASYENDFTTSADALFEVKEYVLPTFFISILPEKNFISYDTFENFEIIVKAKYYYNKKVDNAKVYIRYGIIRDGERRFMPNTIQVRLMNDGEAVFQFNSKKAVKELGYEELEDLDGSYLYLAVSVSEASGGRTEESENFDVKYVLSPYVLSLVGTPLFVKPTLPYHIQVQVKDTLDKPVGNIPITITGEMFKEDGESVFLTDNERDTRTTNKNDGTAKFIVNIPADVTSLEFQIKTADGNLPDVNQATAQYTAQSYKSLTKSYLYINWARQSQVLRVGQYLNVQIVPSSPYLHKLTHYSYLIISKGKITDFGTVPRVHESVSQNLNILITPQMIPSARLLVYYIITGETTAELIADSIWVDIEEKCLNDQKVQLSATKNDFQPGKEISLTLKAQPNSLVALSAVDVSVYDVARKTKRPLERVLRKIEESDLGCGAGAGQNNADVFRLAGLTFLTNANIRAFENYAFKCTDVLRPKRSVDVEEQIQKKANNYRDKRLRKCCLDGVQCFFDEKGCTDGIHRIKKTRADRCVAAFSDCCNFAQSLKEKVDFFIKDTSLGRMYIRTVFDIDEPEVRSYFPESWLWEEHSITNALGWKTFEVKLPDSLTTWEIQGVGMSDKGMCVADPLSILVWKDLFVDVQLPYSVVRGEQVQLKVVVYNYKNSDVKGCVSATVGKEICLYSEPSSGRSKSQKTCYQETIGGGSLKTFIFNVLPLELGLHNINFTLASQFHSEILVKTLRVVSEGIEEERNAGFTLDPQAVRGVTKRRQEVGFKIPPNIVPKSQITRLLSINGKVLGEVMKTVLQAEGIQYLISLPKGSAETELMRVIPVFYVYHYLATANEWHLLGSNTFTSRLDMERKMKEGVTSILSFRKDDFSYSVWQDRDSSAWLTAFAVRIFSEIQNYVNIDQMSTCNTLLWLVENCQLQDGSFRDKSGYQPVKLQSTVPTEARERSLYLTAFVLIALKKAQRICPIAQVQNSINKAEEYLSDNVIGAQTTYSLAITAYALSLLDVTRLGVRTAVTKLKGEAYTKGIGDKPLYRYWKDSLKKFDPAVPSVETARMVETTAYALLAFLRLAEKDYSQPVVKWLQEQQRYGGGFFSTQDTAIALEALTEVAFLDKKLTLNMDVDVAYRRSGKLQSFKLNEKRPFTRPTEIPLPEDLIITTGFSNGVATGNVRTVYHVISPPEENCNFNLKIEKKSDPWEGDRSIFDDDISQAIHLEACARYKPTDNEITSSSHTVMEISLPTGLEVDEKELNKFMNRVDQYVTDYNIEDGRVILHFDSISADEYTCATLTIREMFKVGMQNPGTFKVYEFHAPEQQCTILYNPHAEDRLAKICTGDLCKCFEAKCPKVQTKMDGRITANDRKTKACESDVSYAYKVQVVESVEEGGFVKYTATILDLFKKGTALVKISKKIKFIKKRTCSDFEMWNGEQFLVMGKDGVQIRNGFDFQYEYPLDSGTWVEWWPENCDTQQCSSFSSVLDEFAESILFEGC
ncbi:complement C5 [Spea bombifrons]|uniref:complement C5 n=1 Tax=Spea bombifrons TaxID=233779 RepID=UPI00234943DB|nr:complement C5 [Spea bombifrons]